jgi:formylglycine-generating enzyme required for sulfatase activity
MVNSYKILINQFKEFTDAFSILTNSDSFKDINYNKTSGYFKLISNNISAKEFALALLAYACKETEMITVDADLPYKIGRYAVTYAEWQIVRRWALKSGYGISEGKAASSIHPVVDISWHDAVKWCNAKSEIEGLSPVYTHGNNIYRKGSLTPTANSRQSGFRLPTEGEWAWAACGGKKSKRFQFSGSNDINSVGWHSGNSGGVAHAVGKKAPNELGIYDMSGNVLELCWDISSTGNNFRVIRGGGFSDPPNYSSLNHRDPWEGCSLACDSGMDCVGFRLACSI